jgi:uncharacterized repeat protein (TIGR01451 family)
MLIKSAFIMKTLTLLIGLSALLSVSVVAGKVEHIYHFQNPNVRQAGEYQMFELDKTMLTALPGQPVLPYHQVNLMLPPGEAAISMEIVFSDEIVLSGKFNLYPQQEVRPVSAGSSGSFLKDNNLYSINASIPADPKGQLITSYLNGRSFALSTFTPARYNPVTGKLSYYSTARVVIHTAPGVSAQKALDNLSTQNSSVTKLADNPGTELLYRSRKQSIVTGYDLLIITSNSYVSSFASLQANYLKEGISSLVVTRDSITTTMSGMDVPEKIRNFIMQEYQTHGIQYVLLGGDDEIIPHRGFYCYVVSGSGYSDQNIPADLYYSALDGNWNTDGDEFWAEPGEDDLLPELAVARMPFSNASELSHMLNKSYKYQFTPIPGEFRNILMAGENLWSNPDTWGSDYLELLKGEHSDNGYTTTGIPTDYSFDHLYDETTYWSGQDLMNHLNQGRPMLNHSGHANETYVMKLNNGDITNSNFSGLNGIDHNFTIVYTHGCLCGAFDYNDCIAEKMVTIDNFAAAFVGNSRFGWFNEGQTEGPSAHLHREYMDALYTDSLNRIGRAHMESKIATSSWVTAPGQWEPGALRWCFYDCNVLGDPALAVFTDNPIPISTTYPASVLIGTASINVNVTSGGIPVKGLNCVAMKDGLLIGKSVTDEAGQAIITFDMAIEDPGDAELIVSGYNCVPATYNFAFLPVAGPYVIYAESTVHDPAGNQNNQPDFGETIQLTTGMRNVGGSDASNVAVTLSTSDSYITLSDSTEVYAFIPAGDTLTITDAFIFQVSDIVPNGHIVNFTLKAEAGSTWFSEFTLTCNAPSLAAGGLIIDDATGGNGNGRLDPGETVTLIIPSANNGNSACLNATGTLTSNNPWITITSPVYQLGTLTPGSPVNAEFEIQVSNDAPVSSVVELEYSIVSGGYAASATYFPAIHLIVEDFETGNFEEFPWPVFGQNFWKITNISPLEGQYSSRSAPIGHNQVSTMDITLNVLANDSISFYSKVSSEGIFDKLKFYIDIQPMDEWSGSIPWKRHSYPVTAGVHNFKWVYSKDQYTSAGDDCAYVDFIVFPSFVDYTGQDEVITKPAISLEIAPNPAAEILRVSTRTDSHSKLVFRLYNSEGRTILISEEMMTDSEGFAQRIFDVSGLKPGYYTCEVRSGKHNISRPFVVN